MKFIQFIATKESIQKIAKNLKTKQLIIFGQPVLSVDEVPPSVDLKIKGKKYPEDSVPGEALQMVSTMTIGVLHFKPFEKNSMSQEEYKEVDKAVKKFIA